MRSGARNLANLGCSIHPYLGLPGHCPGVPLSKMGSGQRWSPVPLGEKSCWLTPGRCPQSASPLPSEVLTLPVGVCMLSHCFPKHNAMLWGRGKGAMSSKALPITVAWSSLRQEQWMPAPCHSREWFLLLNKDHLALGTISVLSSPWRVKPSLRKGGQTETQPVPWPRPSCAAPQQTRAHCPQERNLFLVQGRWASHSRS